MKDRLWYFIDFMDAQYIDAYGDCKSFSSYHEVIWAKLGPYGCTETDESLATCCSQPKHWLYDTFSSSWMIYELIGSKFWKNDQYKQP